MEILLALAAAVSYGVSDFAGGLTRRAHVFVVFLPLREAVDLHGAHDFRHTFATWLEDAGIPGDGRPHRHRDRAAPQSGAGGR
jgi:integrase